MSPTDQRRAPCALTDKEQLPELPQAWNGNLGFALQATAPPQPLVPR